MSTLQPEQASLICHSVSIPTLTRENATTLQIIRAIPADKGDYRPDPNSKTAMELAWHMATAEHRFLACIADGAFNFDPFPRPESPICIRERSTPTWNASLKCPASNSPRCSTSGAWSNCLPCCSSSSTSTTSFITADSFPPISAPWARKSPTSTEKATTAPKPAKPPRQNRRNSVLITVGF